MSEVGMEYALARVADVHSRITHERERIKAEVEERHEAELQYLQLEESRLANRARAAGASLSRVGKAMGTTDWRTIKERLALAGEKEEK